MTRRILPLFALVPALALSACGNSGGLTAQGFAAVTTDDATRRFDFPAETRLDGTSPGRFTGTCVLRQMRDGAGEAYWGATVEVHSGGTAPGDAEPLQRVTIVQNSNAELGTGHVEVELGGVLMKTVEGSCSVELEYVLNGVVGLTSACEVADAEDTRRAQVSLELDLAGCDVER